MGLIEETDVANEQSEDKSEDDEEEGEDLLKEVAKKDLDDLARKPIVV